MPITPLSGISWSKVACSSRSSAPASWSMPLRLQRYAEEDGERAHDELVILLLRQAGDGDRADHADVPHNRRECATMRGVLRRIEQRALVQCGAFARMELPQIERAVPEAVDHAILALDPGVVVGAGPWQGAVEELLSVARHVYGQRLTLGARRFEQP